MSKVENRDADILRTTEALAPFVRAKYLRDKIGPDAPFFMRALLMANASDMSGNAFRQLFTFLTFANPDGTSAFPSHGTVAAITGCSVATSERATKELKDGRWISTERTRRGPAVRTIKLPEGERNIAATRDNQEPSPVTVLNDSSKFLNPHPCGSRTLTREGLPTTVDLSTANHGCSLEGEDGEKKEKQSDEVAQPEAARYRNARKRRGKVRSW